jgi:glycogen synthase
MRIVIISNLYPPYHRGGYELGCSDIAERLKQRGHSVSVLTSTIGIGRATVGNDVHRTLQLALDEPFRNPMVSKLRLLRQQVVNRSETGRILRDVRPDVIYIWGQYLLSLNPAWVAERSGYPVVYFVSDPWLAGWDQLDQWYAWLMRSDAGPGGRALRAGARLVSSSGMALEKPRRLELQDVQFCSAYLRDAAVAAGKRPVRTQVIPWGIDTNRFRWREHRAGRSKILFTGQLGAHKGVHTAIRALHVLSRDFGLEGLTLSIVGGAENQPGYGRELVDLVRDLGIQDAVQFYGKVERDKLPEIYRAHDIYVFPSVWAEPFSISLLEAMAAGLGVVSTATGGSREIIEDGVNALVFAPEDHVACAEQIRRYLLDPVLFDNLRMAGREAVIEKYRIESMVDAVEDGLRSAHGL